MRIGGIGSYQSYQDMNYMSGIRGSHMNIPKVGQADPALQDVKLAEDNKEALSQSSVTAVPQAEETRADRIANLEDVSLSFNKEDDFGYIGKDSDIYKLDVEKAISDMKRDSVLQEYQYFVGSSQTFAAQQSADGIVIPKMLFE